MNRRGSRWTSSTVPQLTTASMQHYHAYGVQYATGHNQESALPFRLASNATIATPGNQMVATGSY